jgi:hypothetical protein
VFFSSFRLGQIKILVLSIRVLNFAKQYLINHSHILFFIVAILGYSHSTIVAILGYANFTVVAIIGSPHSAVAAIRSYSHSTILAIPR